LAVADQRLVRKLTQINTIFAPEIQPQLLDYVNDAFIMELLPGITRYLIFAESRDQDYKRALQKATEVLTQLKNFQAEAKQHMKIMNRPSESLSPADKSVA